MTMTGRRFLLTSLLIAGTLGFASAPLRAQSFPLNLEGYSVADQVMPSPARSTVALMPPYRAVGVGTTLQIVDETDPEHLAVVSQVSLVSPALRMLYRSGKLYIAAGTSGLIIMDVSNPAAPTFASSLSSGSPMALAMNEGGKILYIAEGTETIQVINVENSSKPKRVYYLSLTNATFTDLTVVDKYLIAAAGRKGLVVYSLQFPGRPYRISRFKGLEGVQTLSSDPLKPSLFAVCDSYEGLAFVNFPTWKTPALKGSLPLAVEPVSAEYLRGVSERVLVAQASGGYAIVDGSNPEAPVLLSQPATPSPVVAVSTDGRGPYLLCTEGGMYAVDVSNPATPVATLALAGSAPFGALASIGNIAYISRGAHIEIWDCTDPFNLSHVASVPTPAFATDLLISGSLLFAACQQAGVVIYDISGPLAPVQLSTLPVSGSAGQMALSGTLLAIADGSDGLLMADVSVPTAPTAYPTWLGGKNTLVAGVAFSAASTLWLRVDVDGIVSLDVSNPASPVQLGKLGMDSIAGRAYTVSHYIYSMGRGAVNITDTTDPAKPKATTAVNTTNSFFAAFDGTTMYLCDGITGFSEYDITDPSSPVMSKLFGSPTFSYQGLPLANGARLVSAREGGLWTLLPTTCNGNNLYLPCQGAVLSPFTKAAFMWDPAPGDLYTVQISQSPTFPSEKTISDSTDADKKVPYYVPSDLIWSDIVKKARKHGNTLFWRVTYKLGNQKIHSETRTITIP